MILQSLTELHARLRQDPSYDLPRPGFSPQKISFRVVLRPDGTLHDFQDARTPDEKGKLRSTTLMVLGYTKPSGAGLNPCTLWDNQTYLLGRQPEDKPDGFGLARFEAFRDHHLKLESSISNPQYSAVCRFLETWAPERLPEFTLLNELATGYGIFQILGETRTVHEQPEIQRWWLSTLASSDKDVINGQCLVTGKFTPIARLQPKIKGAGGQSAGASIVSFNDPAYESYLKEQSFNAPVSEEASQQYGDALNCLLSIDKHRIRLGDTTCVFWTATPTATEDIFALLASDGDNAPASVQNESLRAKLQAFLKALRNGDSACSDLGEDPNTPFFLLGLSPNAGRLSIRYFHRSTLGELLSNLYKHLSDTSLIKSFPSDPDFPPNWLLLAQTHRKGDDPPPLLAGALLRAVLDGTPYPMALYTAIMRRIQTERNVPYLKAALLKAVLVRNHQQEIPVMLDPELPDPAYRLGRLFAVLEKTQEDAGNTGLRERFYSSASATPATVFPRILRTYTHHLAKIGGGMKIVRERLTQEILAPIQDFPTHLDLIEQGRFALGYYHQRKDLFTSKPKPESLSENNTPPLQGELL